MQNMQIFKALVVDNQDPDNYGRVKIRILGVHTPEDDPGEILDDVLPWADQAIPANSGMVMGGKGLHDVPSKGDWVWGFFYDDGCQHPVYFATMRMGTDKNGSFKPNENMFYLDRFGNSLIIDGSNIKLTKNSGHYIHMEDKVVTIKTKDGNLIKLDDEDGSITIQDENLNIIKLEAGKITMIRAMAENLVVDTGYVKIGSEGPSDVAVLGNVLINWLASHTHAGNLGLQTSPPAQAGALTSIIKPTVQYTGLGTAVISPEELAELLASGPEENPSSTATDAVGDQAYASLAATAPAALTNGQYLYDQSIADRDVRYKVSLASCTLGAKATELDTDLRKVLAEAAKLYSFYISSGYRDKAKQNALYAAGKTPRKFPSSGHNLSPCPCADLIPVPATNSCIEELKDIMYYCAGKLGIKIEWLGNVIMPNGSKDVWHYQLAKSTWIAKLNALKKKEGVA